MTVSRRAERPGEAPPRLLREVLAGLTDADEAIRRQVVRDHMLAGLEWQRRKYGVDVDTVALTREIRDQ